MKATYRLMDHGLVCESWLWSAETLDHQLIGGFGVDADYYLVEFGNEALKLQKIAKEA